MLIFLFLKSERGGRGEEREGAMVANFQSDEGHSHMGPSTTNRRGEIIIPPADKNLV